ncbi:arylsulfatase [Stieleria sp. TO1_6]|uniref:arylsulfatase n=1 Tax=Stieleria tagensis TaxID=2956795 RepID=UPI00209AEDDF|nr:arylsulfatase [Stieleria tagensis]MCO8121508.1 arylsulfatase [Stieleria tagensis]
MNRGVLLTIAVLAVAPLFSETSHAQDKPNIVLIVMDNLGWGEIGVYGGGILRGAETPRLDMLASEGMRLLNFNVETQCTPSRSALMTGRHAIRSGTTKVVWGQLYGLTQWEVTIAELLSEQGYATAMYGKWHLGDTKGRFPTDQGFDDWYGIPNTTDESLYTAGFMYDPKVLEPPSIMESKRGEQPKKVKVYDREARRRIDAELAERTVDFMKRSVAANKPFFAYVPFTLVHVPTLPHPDFDGKTGNGRWADALAELDYRAGQVLDAIDDLNVRENTIVIWLSENGPEELFPHNGTAGPWRGTYFTALEGSLRAPFLVRWPGKIKAGSVNNEIVHIADLYPTLARIGGAKMPTDRTIDGLDQTDFLTGKAEHSPREGFPVYNGDLLQAYKWRNWKLHFMTQDTMGSIIERPGMPRLYNLLTDPKEEYDLVEKGGEWGEKNFWVMPPISKLVNEHAKSLMDEPPIKLGTPEPYRPGK